MKPLVIYIADKEIKLTKEELEKYLKEAYDAGHNDGYNKGYAAGKSYGWWNNPTITTPYYNTELDKTSNPVFDPYKITCEPLNAIGD